MAGIALGEDGIALRPGIHRRWDRGRSVQDLVAQRRRRRVRARLQIGALGTVTGNTRVVRNRGRTVLEVPANPVLRSTPSAGSGPGVTHSAVLASTVRDALRVGHVIER